MVDTQVGVCRYTKYAMYPHQFQIHWIHKSYVMAVEVADTLDTQVYPAQFEIHWLDTYVPPT